MITLHAYGPIVRTRGGRLLFGPCRIKESQLVLAFNLEVETFAGFKCPVFAHTHVVWYPLCKCLLLYSHVRVVIKCDLNLNYWLSQTIQMFFSNQSSETRGKQPHDITSIRRFISGKKHSVISVFAGRNVIALRLFELLIF